MAKGQMAVGRWALGVGRWTFGVGRVFRYCTLQARPFAHSPKPNAPRLPPNAQRLFVPGRQLAIEVLDFGNALDCAVERLVLLFEEGNALLEDVELATGSTGLDFLHPCGRLDDGLQRRARGQACDGNEYGQHTKGSENQRN